MSAIRPYGHHPHRFSLAFALGVRAWLAVFKSDAHPVHLARWSSGFFHAPDAMKRHLPSHLQEGRFYWRTTRLWLPRAAAAALLKQTNRVTPKP